MSNTTPTAKRPPICNYEGSDYRTRFWQDQGRDYEDLAERIALRHLLPQTGTRLLEIGTGFGRLVELYQGYEHVLLLDYSKSLLREAQERLGAGSKYTYVAADLYRLPLLHGVTDTVTMVRVIHHVADVPQALRQIHRVLQPGGKLLLEFASKHHLKSLLRYVFRRQSWSPFDLAPVEFATLNFDFHPRWMHAQLAARGFEVEDVRTVSHFRVPLLKRLVPARALAALDGALQWTGRFWTLTPSVFVLARRAKEGSKHNHADSLDGINPAALFRCPRCSNSQWHASSDQLRCLACQTRWRIDDGIYDFRDPA